MQGVGNFCNKLDGPVQLRASSGQAVRQRGAVNDRELIRQRFHIRHLRESHRVGQCVLHRRCRSQSSCRFDHFLRIRYRRRSIVRSEQPSCCAISSLVYPGSLDSASCCSSDSPRLSNNKRLSSSSTHTDPHRSQVATHTDPTSELRTNIAEALAFLNNWVRGCERISWRRDAFRVPLALPVFVTRRG